MAEKRMMILPADLVKKVDENRGDMSQAEFIDYLISGKLGATEKAEPQQPKYVTEEQFRSLEQDIKKLLRSFLEFFISYGMEIGKKSQNGELEEIASRLQGLEKELDSEENNRKGTIRWK